MKSGAGNPARTVLLPLLMQPLHDPTSYARHEPAALQDRADAAESVPQPGGTRFRTAAGTLPPVAEGEPAQQAQSSADRAFGVDPFAEIAAIRNQLFAGLLRHNCEGADTEQTQQAQFVTETATAKLFIQHVYIRNYERGGLSEVFPEAVLTAPITEGKQNVIGVCVHWQRENPQVPGTFYENGNQAIVAPPVGAPNNITRYSGEHQELFVVTQDAANPAPQFALKSHDGGGFINNPAGALSVYSDAEQQQTIEGERAAAKESKENALEAERAQSLEAEIATLSTGPSPLGGAMGTLVVRERNDGQLVVDSSVAVDRHAAVRVINATGKRLDVNTSQKDGTTLAPPRWRTPKNAVVDHGDFLVPAGGHLNIGDQHVKVTAG